MGLIVLQPSHARFLILASRPPRLILTVYNVLQAPKEPKAADPEELRAKLTA